MKRSAAVGGLALLPLLLLLVPSLLQAQAATAAEATLKAAAPAPRAAPASEVPAQKVAPISDPDGVRVSGLLQVDGVAFEQSSVDELDPGSRAPLNQERLLLRRARLRLDGRYGYVRGSLQIDANTINGPNIRVLSAELAVAYPAETAAPLIELAAGLMFIPFGFETSELVTSRLFLEASTWVNALFPGRRDLGIRLSGAWLFLRYALAVMNGNPSSSAALPLREPNRAKDIVGRIGVEGALTRWLSAHGGVSGLMGRGFHPGAAPTKDDLIVRDANEDGIVQPSEIQLVPGEPGEPSRNFGRNALGADLGFDYDVPWLGWGRVYGEVSWVRNLDRALFIADPVAQGRSARELGFMAAFRQSLTRHAELGVRFDGYNPDRDQSQRQGTSIVPTDSRFSTVAVAAAWCSLARLRVVVQFDHRKNPLGRSASGAPTTLAADSLTLRAQLEL